MEPSEDVSRQEQQEKADPAFCSGFLRAFTLGRAVGPGSEDLELGADFSSYQLVVMKIIVTTEQIFRTLRNIRN